MRCTINDIAIVTMGQSPKSEFYNSNGEGLPFLQGNRTFGRLYPTFDTYTTFPTKIAEAGDVIMSVRAPVGDLNITPVKMCLGRGVCSLRMKNGNQQFLYYLMKAIVPQLISKEGGTVFGSVNRNDICSQEVDIPEDAEHQRVIARYLSAIDEKIETNHRINDNLEQQASVLVEQYFESVSSIVPFAEIMSFENGFAFQSSTYLPSGQYRIITIKNVQDGQIDTTGAACIDELPQRMKEGCVLQIGDALLSLTGNVGRVGIVCENGLLLNQRVAKIVPYRKELLPLLYFIYRQPSTKTQLESIAKGTAQLNLSPVETLKLTVPYNSEVALDLSHTLTPIYQAIIANNQQSIILASMRDALLPKLMSGEIDVTGIGI